MSLESFSAQWRESHPNQPVRDMPTLDLLMDEIMPLMRLDLLDIAAAYGIDTNLSIYVVEQQVKLHPLAEVAWREAFTGWVLAWSHLAHERMPATAPITFRNPDSA